MSVVCRRRHRFAPRRKSDAASKPAPSGTRSPSLAKSLRFSSTPSRVTVAPTSSVTVALRSDTRSSTVRVPSTSIRNFRTASSFSDTLRCRRLVTTRPFSACWRARKLAFGRAADRRSQARGRAVQLELAGREGAIEQRSQRFDLLIEIRTHRRGRRPEIRQGLLQRIGESTSSRATSPRESESSPCSTGDRSKACCRSRS